MPDRARALTLTDLATLARLSASVHTSRERSTRQWTRWCRKSWGTGC